MRTDEQIPLQAAQPVEPLVLPTQRVSEESVSPVTSPATPDSLPVAIVDSQAVELQVNEPEAIAHADTAKQAEQYGGSRMFRMKSWGARLVLAASMSVGIGAALEQPASANPVSAAEQANSTAQPNATSVERIPTTEHALSEKEMQRITEATKWTGFENSNVTVVEQYRTKNSITKILSVNGAKLGVDSGGIADAIQSAEAIAASHPNFSTKMQMGPGEENYKQVDFAVSPSSELVPEGEVYTHYIFVAKDVAPVTSPVVDPSNAADTFNVQSQGISVSVIAARPHTVWKMPAGIHLKRDAYYLRTELLQSRCEVLPTDASYNRLEREHTDMSYMTSSDTSGNITLTPREALSNRGMEVNNNSWAYALSMAKLGVPYHRYAEWAVTITLSGLPADANNQLHDFAVSKTQYKGLASNAA